MRGPARLEQRAWASLRIRRARQASNGMGSLASLICSSRLSISEIARARSSAGACVCAMRRRYRCGMSIPRIRLHHGARPTYPHVRSIQATGDCERPLGLQNLNCLELLYAFVPFPYAVFAGLSARKCRLKGRSWRCSNTLDTQLRADFDPEVLQDCLDDNGYLRMPVLKM